MKFASKITLCMSLLIAIVFSIGGYFMIKDNFDANLSSVANQNVAQHTMERYALESALNRQVENGASISDAEVLKSLQSLSGIGNQNNRSLAAFRADKTQMYASNHEDVSAIFQSAVPKEAFRSQYQIDAHNETLNITTYIVKGTYEFYFMSRYDVSSIYAQRSAQLRSFLLLNVFVTLLSFGVIYLMTRYLTHPIKELSDTSKKILAGNYDERCMVHSQDEIGELADSFNQMSGALASKIYALEEAAKQKDAFVASFTHEMKTPMTAIIGYSDLLRQQLADEDTAQMAYDFIFHEGQRLESLSHDLLDIFMMQDSEITLEVVDILPFCEHVKQDLELLYPNVTLTLCMEEANIYAKTTLLDCLLRNLITNAVHADGSPIQICGHQGTNGYILSVQDHGSGIPKEALEHIKDPFYRVDVSRSRASGGNGLGLTICERIAQLHHTTLNIESKEGSGTMISLLLMQVEDEK